MGPDGAQDPALPESVVRSAVALRLGLLTQEVVGAMRARDIDPILLKGPVLAQWLYEAGERRYGDVDLMVGQSELTAAEQVLEGLGFTRERVYQEADLDRWHAFSWHRKSDGASVDLHRSLVGVTVDPAAAWPILRQHVTNFDLHGTSVTSLDRAGLCFHLALHAGQHGRGEEWPLEDLRRGIERASSEEWADAYELALGLGATEAFASGLTLVPEGREVAGHLALQPVTSTEARLRAENAPWAALTLEWFTRTKGFGPKARMVVQKLFPSPSYMRLVDRRAQTGPLGLLAAYVTRPGVMLVRLVRASKALRRARSGR